MSNPNSPITRTDMKVLVREIDALKRQVRDLQRTPQLHNSAIENGALTSTVADADAEGNETVRDTMYVGLQYDGTSTAASVNGPPPPMTTPPSVAAATGGAAVTWDGLFADDPLIVAPMDFARVEIHAHTNPAFTAEQSNTIVGTFETPRGGTRHVPLPLDVEYTIKFVVRSQSGGRSLVSVGTPVTRLSLESGPTAAPTASPALVVTPWSDGFVAQTGPIDLYSVLAYHVSTAAGFTPGPGTTAKSDTRSQNVLIEHMPDGSPFVRGTAYYFKVVESNEIDAAPPSAEVSAQLRVYGASDIPDLAEAADDANQALLDAAAAQEAAAAAQNAADGAIRTYYQEDPPWADNSTQPDTVLGDLWFKESDDQAYRWNGTIWKVIEDSTISAALAAAQQAVTTYTVEYAVNASETVAPTTGWSTTTPTRTPGTFVWTRTTVTRNNGTTSTTNPALLTGNTGAPGAAGTPAATVALTATTQVLTSPAAGGATTPATAVVTGSALNTAIAVWEYSVNGAAFSATVPAGVSRTGNVVTITGATMTARTIAVRMASASGVADTLTVAKVVDGAAGGAGSPGADAVTVVLTNEAQVFAGSAAAALAGSAVSGVLAFKAATQIAATIGTITGQVTGLTTSIQNNGSNTAQFTVTVTTALVQQSGVLTVPLTVDGKSFTKTFAWSVSYTGTPGSPGNPGTAGISVTAITPFFAQLATGTAAPAQPGNVATPSAPWVATEPAYAANTELWITNRVTYSNGTYAYTTVVKSSAYTAANAAAAAAANKVRWLASAPVNGTTLGAVGDLIYVKSGATIDSIWEATAANTWTQRFVAEAAIGALAVGKITGLQTALNSLTGDLTKVHIIDPIPDLTAQSPTAGSIAWPTFDVKYGGLTTTVPAGDAVTRWVVFRWNSGAPTIEETDTRPVLAAGDYILFANNGGVGIRIFAAVNVDGDLIVDGTVTTTALAAQAVTTEKLAAEAVEAENLAADAITVNHLLADDVAAQAIASAGLTIAGNQTWNGTTGLTIPDVMNIPPNDSLQAFLWAKFTARELTVENYLKILGTINEISVGASVALAGAVTNPTNLPLIQDDWQQVVQLQVPEGVSALRGLHKRADGGWATLRLISNTECEIIRFNSAGVIVARSQTISDVSAYSPGVSGFCYNAALDRYFIASKPYWYNSYSSATEDDSNIALYSITGNFTAASPITTEWSISSKGRNYPGGAGDKWNYCQIVYYNATYFAIIAWRKDYGSSLGQVVAYLYEWTGRNTNAESQYVGGEVSISDYGIPDLTIKGATYGRPPGNTNNSLLYWTIWKNGSDPIVAQAPAADAAVPRAFGRSILGAHAEGAMQHYSLDNTGAVFAYEQVPRAGQIAYSWRDSDPAGTGEHETALTTPLSITAKRGARVRVTATPAPDTGDTDAPNLVSVYGRVGTSGTFYKQADIVPPAQSVSIGMPLQAAANAYGTIPSFASANIVSARLFSAAADLLGSIINLKGDGSGRAGPLIWDSSGKTPWTTFTPALTAFTTNPTGYTSSASRYKIEGDEVTVEYRITLGSSIGSGVYSIALPVAAADVEGGIGTFLCKHGASTFVGYEVFPVAGGTDIQLTNANGRLTHVSQAWTSGDTFNGRITYRKA